MFWSLWSIPRAPLVPIGVDDAVDDVHFDAVAGSVAWRCSPDGAALYLATGAQEFWVVDARRRTVSVAVQGSGPAVYGIGDRIPLGLFGGELAVAEVFGR